MMHPGAIADTPQGLKPQCEGHDVRCRNAWIKEGYQVKQVRDLIIKYQIQPD